MFQCLHFIVVYSNTVQMYKESNIVQALRNVLILVVTWGYGCYFSELLHKMPDVALADICVMVELHEHHQCFT